MMLRSGTKCETKCLFCALSLSRQVSSSTCKDEDFTPEKRLKLETNVDTHQALHEALRSKDCSTVRHLLDAGENLCCTDGIENCFILITKFYNCECLERVLTSQPAAIHCRGPQGQTLLMYAKDFDTMKTLFKFEPDVNACNDSGQNVLIRLIRENMMNYAISSFDVFFEMAQYVLKKGINASATDALGKTAIEYVLKFDINMNYTDPPLRTDELFEKLLEAGAPMPGADSFGRTPAMHFARDRAYMPQYNWFTVYLLQRGVDPKARDNDGHNLMYYVIKSYYTAVANLYDDDDVHSDFLDDSEDSDDENFEPNLHQQWCLFTTKISQQCSVLLRCGCELGGLDAIYDHNRLFSFKVGYFHLMRKEAKSANILSLLLRREPFSDFIKQLPQHNLSLKKSKSCVSELTYYLVDSDKWPISDEAFEVVEATVTHLLASGVNVMQQLPDRRHRVDHDDEEKGIFQSVPDSLWLAAQLMLRVAEYVRENRDVKKPYYISCKILVTLLRFWNYPPLILFIFMYVDYLDTAYPGNTMLKFLIRVGGRLPPGSPLFKRMMKTLEKLANGDWKLRVPRQLFSKLHAEIPTLKELCRPAVRATLSKVTTSGLDLSSLRVLFQGEMREIPLDIQDYLNFKDQPMYCEDDLAE